MDLTLKDFNIPPVIFQIDKDKNIVSPELFLIMVGVPLTQTFIISEKSYTFNKGVPLARTYKYTGVNKNKNRYVLQLYINNKYGIYNSKVFKAWDSRKNIPFTSSFFSTSTLIVYTPGSISTPYYDLWITVGANNTPSINKYMPKPYIYTNIPLFSTSEEVTKYYNTGEGLENALNYGGIEINE